MSISLEAHAATKLLATIGSLLMPGLVEELKGSRILSSREMLELSVVDASHVTGFLLYKIITFSTTGCMTVVGRYSALWSESFARTLYFCNKFLRLQFISAGSRNVGTAWKTASLKCRWQKWRCIKVALSDH